MAEMEAAEERVITTDTEVSSPKKKKKKKKRRKEEDTDQVQEETIEDMKAMDTHQDLDEQIAEHEGEKKKKKKHKKKYDKVEEQEDEPVTEVDVLAATEKKKKKKKKRKRDEEEIGDPLSQSNEDDPEETDQAISASAKKEKRRRRRESEHLEDLDDDVQDPDWKVAKRKRIREENEEEELIPSAAKKKKKRRKMSKNDEEEEESMAEKSSKKKKKKKRRKEMEESTENGEQDWQGEDDDPRASNSSSPVFPPTAVNRILKELSPVLVGVTTFHEESNDVEDEQQHSPQEEDVVDSLSDESDFIAPDQVDGDEAFSQRIMKRQQRRKETKLGRVSPLQKLLLEEDMFQVMTKVDTAGCLGPEDIIFPDEDPRFFMGRFYKLPLLDRVADKVAYKAICWILRNDFSLPALNRSRKNCFWALSGEIARETHKKFPKFRSGRFTDAEDAVLLKRLQVLMAAVNLESEETKTLFKDISNYKRDGNRINCRLILGAYLGRPMLEYRRVIDIFHRMKALMNRQKKTTLDSETVKKVAEFVDSKVKNGVSKLDTKVLTECRKELGIADLMKNDRVAAIYRESKRHREVRRGRFTDEELDTLVYLVLKQISTTSVTKFVPSKILWQEIGDEMCRSAPSVMKVWTERIYPILAMHIAGEDVDDQSWRPQLIELILSDSSITERQHINWSRMQEHFPYQTVHSLRKVLDNYVLNLFGKKSSNFREALQSGMEYLRQGSMKRDQSHKIVEIFEDVRTRLQHEVEK